MIGVHLLYFLEFIMKKIKCRLQLNIAIVKIQDEQFINNKD